MADSFVMGGDFGWFCMHCPVVVINANKVSEMLKYSLPHWTVGNQFTVMGTIDLNAIPEDKREMPMGEENNPIPLVPFIDPITARKRAAKLYHRRKKHKRK